MDFLSEFKDEYRPPSKFHFRVDFPAVAPGGFGFKEVSGIEVNWETETISEGGLNTYSYKVPGKISFPNLTLKRGIVGMTSPLVAWLNIFMNLGVNGILATMGHNNLTTPINVTLLDENSLPNMMWSFVGAFPVKWSVDTLDSEDDDSVLIEEIELAYSYFIRTL
jgi:phage tail-like protein